MIDVEVLTEVNIERWQDIVWLMAFGKVNKFILSEDATYNHFININGITNNRSVLDVFETIYIEGRLSVR